MSILRRTSRIAVLAAALAAAVPTVASAATRYVAPGGKSSGTCDAAAPCSYSYVFKSFAAGTGDTVVMKEGTYDIGKVGLTIDRRLDVVADPQAATRPLIRTTLDNATAVHVGVLGWGTTLKGLDIEATSKNGGTALDLAGDATATDLNLTCGERCVKAGTNNSRIVLQDSRVAMSGGGLVAIELDNGGTVRRTAVKVSGGGSGVFIGPASLLEDTTIDSDGSGAGFFGGTVQRVAIRSKFTALFVSRTTLVRDALVIATAPYADALETDGTATARNVTAVAPATGGAGLSTIPSGPKTPASIDARNVIARGAGKDVDGYAPSAGGFGCPCPDSTIDIAYSNFRTKGDAVVDHGVAGHNQSADPLFVDAPKGDYRLAPGSPAIDAGTLDASLGLTDVAGGPRKKGAAPDLGAFETTPPPTPADHTAPLLSKVKVKRNAPARVTFTLSEKATVKVTIRRKLKAGKPATVRTLTFAGKKGPNSGRIAKTALQPGRFTVTLIATDAAKNKSTPITRKLLVTAP